MFVLKIETANDAFADDPASEVVRILKDLSASITKNGMDWSEKPIRDINGNTIGYAEYEPDEMEEEDDMGEDE